MNNLFEGCKDQNGSRLIQLHFEKASDEEKEKIFQQILPFIHTLIEDVFGNYVIQKILEVGTMQQKIKIYEQMKGKIWRMSHHTYGCRVVQRALEEFKTKRELQLEILQELSADISTLIQDQNGNHVIQKCFETIPTENLQFIIDEVTEKVIALPQRINI